MSHTHDNVKGVQTNEISTSPAIAKDRDIEHTHPIFDLQNQMGNQWMLNRMQGCLLFLQRCPTGGVCHLCPESTTSSSHGYIQPKLKIGQPNDKYEQEADRVAEQVMRMPEPKIQKKSECPLGDSSCSDRDTEEDTVQPKPISEQVTPLIQKQVEEEELQMKPISEHITPLAQRQPEEEEEAEPVEEPEEEEEELLLKPAGGQTTHVSPSLQAQIHSLPGGGQPLSREVRNFFEPRFGYDFSKVRVHTGERATETTNTIQARAFTVGRNIAFGPGHYAPHSHEGRRLLAHELTHFIQQKGKVDSPAGIIQRQIVAVPTTEQEHIIGRTLPTIKINTFRQLAGYYYGDPTVKGKLWYKLCKYNEGQLKVQLREQRSSGKLKMGARVKLSRLERDFTEKIPSETKVLIPPYKSLISQWLRSKYATKYQRAKARRWGQDTNGTFLSLKVGSDCYSRWPYHIEKHARDDLRISGAASCNTKYAGRIAKVWDRKASRTQKNPIEVVCADTSGKSDDYIELSPAAARALAGSNFVDKHPVRIKYQTHFDSALVYKLEKYFGTTLQYRKSKRCFWKSGYPPSHACITQGCLRNRNYSQNIEARKIRSWPPK